jgi:hypothetical protein
MSSMIPQDDQARKDAPMYRGLLGYFPAALFEVAAHSLASDRKHNGDAPGGPRWARGKSTDHEDTIIRHLIDAGKRGSPDRRYHLRCIAWRALALLQEDCEADGAEPGASSVFPSTVAKMQTPRPTPLERWGVFYVSGSGKSHRSSDLRGVYGSQAEADKAIASIPSDIRRFSARLGEGEK